MTRALDVLGIGNAVVDIIYSVGDKELDERDLTKGSMQLIDAATAAEVKPDKKSLPLLFGGSIANTVCHIAKLGGSVHFIGKLATDSIGSQYIDDLKASGVGFDTARLATGTTGRCFVFVTPDGQRTMCTHLGVSDKLATVDIDVQAIKKSKILLIEGYLWSAPSAKELILESVAIAQANQTLIAFSLSDPFLVAAFRSEFWNFVEKDVDILFGNELEARALCGTNSVDESIGQLAQITDHFIITQGETGSVAVVQGETFRCSATPVERVVDTTGAGDSFAAGYLFGFVERRSTAESLAIASNLAADTVGHFGGR